MISAMYAPVNTLKPMINDENSGVNITENLSIDYNFSVENDFSGTNYSLLSTSFNSEKFKTSFDDWSTVSDKIYYEL